MSLLPPLTDAARRALQAEQQAGAQARIVRRASWAGADGASPHQLRFALEDALRTAAFDDCGRLIVVRQLRLRAAGPRPGPGWLSQALQQAWRHAATQALPADHPAAEAAPAVWFASASQARVLALQRLAGGQPLSAWFWPQALPELRAAQAPGPAVQANALVEQVLALSEAPAVLDAWRRWPDAMAVSLACRLDARLLEALAAHLGAPAPAGSAAPAGTAEPRWPRDEAMQRSASALAARLAVHPPLLAQPQALGVVATLWAAPLPRPAQAAAGPQARQWLVQQAVSMALHRSPVEASTPRASTPHAPAADPARADAAVAAAARGSAPAGQAPGAGPQQPTFLAKAPASGRARTRTAVDAVMRPRRRAAADAPPDPPPTLPWLADAHATGHGGLLFLLNALQALHFDEWLAQQPASLRAPFVALWFRLAADSAGLPPDDPQRPWFAPTSGDDAAARVEAALFDDGRLCGERAARCWLARVRRALRRHAGLGLRELCARQARVAATPTHIDVVYRLDDADPRLRRIGLDADPGWLPWFGWIVSFHFIDTGPQGAEDADG